MNWARFVPLLLLLLLGLAFWRGLGRDPTTVPSPLIGRAAPPFDLPSLTAPAQRVTLVAQAGRPFLLNVWGSWCVGCREEHARLVDMAQRQGMRIVGLDWKDDAEAARAFLAALGDPYLAVAEDADGRAAIDWGVYGAPETFVVDARGVIRYKHVGPLTDEAVTRLIAPLLAQLEREPLP